MTMVLNAIIVSVGMIFMFFVFFLVIFLVAITLFPIEKSISKVIWDATAPPQQKPQKQGGFKDFSQKH